MQCHEDFCRIKIQWGFQSWYKRNGRSENDPRKNLSCVYVFYKEWQRCALSQDLVICSTSLLSTQQHQFYTQRIRVPFVKDEGCN